MAFLSVRDVHDHIVDLITRGEFGLGAKLPTSRDLAETMGVHRNTVAKAYRQLADEGLVHTQQGRGTFVTASPGGEDRRTLLTQVEERLGDVLRRAVQLGLAREHLEHIVENQIEAVYAERTRRAAFVECNDGDLTEGVREIEAQTGLRLAGVLLGDLKADPAAVAGRYAVVCTSLFHVNEVARLFEGIEGAPRVLGLYMHPDEASLTTLAALEPGAPVAVIATTAPGAARFVSQMETVNTLQPTVLVRPTAEMVREVAADVVAIVASRAQAPMLRSLDLPHHVPLIVLGYHISPASAPRILAAVGRPSAPSFALPERELQPAD